MSGDGVLMEHGSLGLIVMDACKDLGKKVEEHLKIMRNTTNPDNRFIIPMDQTRFSNGEGKIRLRDSVRAKDVYILCDVGNYNCTYRMFGFENHMGPDEHFQDIKRALSAIGGKAERVTVIMPLLYAARQHKRKGRESLDCAMALQELERMGVNTIITFDAHDPTIANAIPMVSFENIYPTYSILKSFMQEEGLGRSRDNLLVISPDSGAMDRAVYYANVLGLDVGMFYKRRDHSTIVNGKNPIVQHEYIGRSVDGMNVLIVDDMIASGESMLDVIREVKKRGAKSVFVATTFAFFTEGLEKITECYRQGLLTRLYSTNLSYLPDSLRNEPWFVEVDASKFIAKIINTINQDHSISPLLNTMERIKNLLAQQQA